MATSIKILGSYSKLNEGNKDFTSFTYLVSRTGDKSGISAVNWTVAGKGPNSADSGDFGSLFPSGTIVFAAGETDKTLTVNVKSDTILEANENFQVTLSNPTNGATITTATADGIIVDDDFTAAKLGNALVGTGVNISNASYTGDTRAVGLFNSPSLGIGINSGIVLSSGDIAGIYGPNTKNNLSTNFQKPGDTDLNSLVKQSATHDASVLEFDFIPTSNFLSFQYVFASDEYNEYVGSKYNDVFGFFLTDSKGNKQNIAVVPGVNNVPIAINNINGSTNSAYFRNNSTKDFGLGKTPINTEFDGVTTVLTAVAKVTSGQSYHFKLGVADNSDSSYDSAVLITSDSFTATPLVAIDDSAKVTKDKSIKISVLENDVASTGNSLAISSFNSTSTKGGSVTLDDNGTTTNKADDKLVYKPTLGFVGFDSFKYVITDNKGNTDTASVSIQVEAKPVAVLSIVAKNAIQAEGNSGVKEFTFTVSRSQDTIGTTSVNWAVLGDGINPSDASDFGGVLPSGTVNFLAGESSKTISVYVKGDTLFEQDESFIVGLSSPTDGDVISTAEAIGIIKTDDVNIAPTLTSFTSTVASGNEDSQITISLNNLKAQGNEADIDGIVDGFIVKEVSSGVLLIGGTAATATAWNATTNNIIDATHLAFWTPAANANGNLNAFTVLAKDNYGLTSATPVQTVISVTPVNDAPTLTTFASSVASGSANSSIGISFENLQAQGNEADIDGIVTGFVVKAVSTGSLKIGNSISNATAWVAGSNDTVDANHQAFWTPAANASGNLNAFTLLAKDDGGLLSTSPVQATVAITPIINLVDFDDFYQGSSTNNSINGLAGDDVLYGRDGNDLLIGSTGDDSIYGGSGSDVLVGDSGDNVLAGGSGNDKLYAASINAEISLSNKVSNQLLGGSGNDSLVASLGSDELNGGSGNDTADFSNINNSVNVDLKITDWQNTWGAQQDNLIQIENLTGSSFADKLIGNEADNILIGGLGKDDLTGGAGADIFKYSAVADSGITSLDVIFDFSHAKGDKIDLTSIDANTSTTVSDVFFAPIVGTNFSGVFTKPGQLFFEKSSNILYGNNDNDKNADFAIKLLGVKYLDASDFI